MLYFDYEFTIRYFSLSHITPSVVPCTISVNTAPENSPKETTKDLWQDVLNCFTQGQFHTVARILCTLPYNHTPLGAFEITGPLRKRQDIFHLLTPYREKRPHVGLVVKIKFFRFPRHNDPTLELIIEHWVGRMWNIKGDSMPSLHQAQKR